MDGKKLDKILEFIIQFKSNNIFTDMIKRDLFPEMNNSQIKQLILEIKKLKPEIADIYEGNANITIASNELTKPFLNDGGFTKIEVILLAEQSKKIEKSEIEFEKSKVDLELAKRMLKEYPKTKWFARIGLFIAVVLAFKELYMFFTQ